MHFQFIIIIIMEICIYLHFHSFFFPAGLITLDELHQRVLKGRGKYAQDVSQ